MQLVNFKEHWAFAVGFIGVLGQRTTLWTSDHLSGLMIQIFLERPQHDICERRDTAKSFWAQARGSCFANCECEKTREHTMNKQNERGLQAKINSEAYNQTYTRIAATNSPTYERMNKNNELKVTENMRWMTTMHNVNNRVTPPVLLLLLLLCSYKRAECQLNYVEPGA